MNESVKVVSITWAAGEEQNIFLPRTVYTHGTQLRISRHVIYLIH